MFKVHKILFFLVFGIALTMYCTDANAGVFSVFALRTGNFAKGLQQIAFVLSGFGIIMFTWAAICGKINFKHLGYITICLFFLAGTGYLIRYISGMEPTNLAHFAKPTSFTSGSAHDTYKGIAGGSKTVVHNSSL